MSRTLHIESAANPRFKSWRRTAAGQVRKTGRTLVAGRRIVTELIELEQADIAWILPDDFTEPLPGPEAVPRFVLARTLFKELDQLGTGYPLLDVPIADRIGPLPDTLEPGIHVAVPTQDPVNVGAIVRTAVGLGVESILLLPGAAHPFHPRTVRASAGAVFRIPLRTLPALADLADHRCPVFALEADGEDIRTVPCPERAVLLVGQEGPGHAVTADENARERLPWRRVSVPMSGIESYNAGVAAALALYEWTRQREPSGRSRG